MYPTVCSALPCSIASIEVVASTATRLALGRAFPSRASRGISDAFICGDALPGATTIHARVEDIVAVHVDD